MIAPFRFEIKSLSDTTGEIEGLASSYNVDQGGDRIVAGAFAKSIAAQPDGIVMLFSHDTAQPIGRWSALTETAAGLHVRGQLVLGVAKARETLALLKARAVTGLSIGYTTTKSDFTRDGVRQIKELALHEISVVALPMNVDAKVIAVKASEITSEREFEAFLREAGWPRSRAKILSKGFVPAAAQRDAGAAAVADLVRAMKARIATLQRKT